MNELSKEKTMTIKEIADVLNVNVRTIQFKAKELFPDKIKERETTYFNEMEVSMIKNACEKKFADIKTDYDMQLQTVEVIKYWTDKYKETELKLKESENKVNRLIHSNKLYTTTEIAKELQLKSAQELNQILHDKGIQYQINNTWVLSASYSDKNYQSIKQNELDSGIIIYDRKWTGNGRDFILNLFKV